METFGVNFRKFLRVRRFVKDMRAGAYMGLQEHPTLPVGRHWVVLDRSNSLLLWDEVSDESTPLSQGSSVALRLDDVVELERHDPPTADGVPAISLATPNGTIVVLHPESYRDLEMWYQGLAYLCEVADTATSHASSPASSSRPGAAEPELPVLPPELANMASAALADPNAVPQLIAQLEAMYTHVMDQYDLLEDVAEENDYLRARLAEEQEQAGQFQTLVDMVSVKDATIKSLEEYVQQLSSVLFV